MPVHGSIPINADIPISGHIPIGGEALVGAAACPPPAVQQKAVATSTVCTTVCEPGQTAFIDKKVRTHHTHTHPGFSLHGAQTGLGSSGKYGSTSSSSVAGSKTYHA